MKILADLGLQRETIKQVSWKAFIFFQKSSDLFQFGKIGKRILVFDELQILAGFESCSWQYCFRLALKQNYKTGYITQAGHGFKLLIRSVRSGIWGGGGSGSPSTVMRLCPAVIYPPAGGCAALLSIWVQNEYVWMGAVSRKSAGVGCFLHLQVGSALFPCALKSLCCLL